MSLLVLLAGLLGSALLRMSIYTSEYGLTEERLFATVFMGWLAFVFASFGATVLRRRRERFTASALGFGARDAVAAQRRRARRGDRPDECVACGKGPVARCWSISRASVPAPCRRRSVFFRPFPPPSAATGPVC